MIDQLLGNEAFKEYLVSIGFEHIGSAWWMNEDNTIRIRVWKDRQVDIWLWRNNVDQSANEIRYRGEIWNFEDVKWILDRCFN